ncbi:MAG: nicotinamide mononucleotide transporter [Saprospiraceae bacterium]|nr:nicotinamide mononucleotide transporter [Saprospiraceae bacterium]
MEESTGIFEHILQQVQAQSFFDWGAVVCAILYLYLISLENPWGWGWGIISCAFWAYAAYFQYDLYVDAILQLFYIVISFWGVYQWLKGEKDQEKLMISWLRTRDHIWLISTGLLASLIGGWLFETYTQAAAPYWDAFTTVFSIITTFLVIYKKIDNWIYWLLIDSVYVGLYWSRGGYLFSVLFLVYLFIVVKGYFSWRVLYKQQDVV